MHGDYKPSALRLLPKIHKAAHCCWVLGVNHCQPTFVILLLTQEMFAAGQAEVNTHWYHKKVLIATGTLISICCHFRWLGSDALAHPAIMKWVPCTVGSSYSRLPVTSQSDLFTFGVKCTKSKPNHEEE